MKLSIIQPDTKWEDKNANFSILDKMISELDSDTDLIILPEMFNTGFSMNTGDLGELRGGETFEWMKSIAKNRLCGICGSYIVRSGRNFYNRWVFVAHDSKSRYYNKRHLFSMGGEHLKFCGGNKRITFSFRGVKIFPEVCYDLRFPVWSCNTDYYDLLINTANWPEPRRDVWMTLLRARALENQCYVAGANRIGKDGLGITYTGDSLIVNPRGETLALAEKNKERSITAEISIPELKKFRKIFPVLKDNDKFRLVL